MTSAVTPIVASAASSPATGLSPMQDAVLSRVDSIFASIASSVESVSDAAIKGGKVIADQIPDVAMQYIAYGRAKTTVILLIVFLCIFIAYKFCKYANTVDNENSQFGATIMGVIIFAIGVISFFSNYSDFLMVWFAPKVWLLQEIVQMVKTIKGG